MQGQQWKLIKKDLPGNYLQEISQRLEKQDIILRPQQIRDIRRGKNKNMELTKIVWQEIRKIIHERKKEKRFIHQLQTIKDNE